MPETELDKNGTWHEWRLELESEDIKLNRTFEIPVYETKQQSTVSYQVPQYLTEHKQKVDLEMSLPMREQGDEVMIHYPMFYKPTTKIVMGVIALFMFGMLSVFSDEIPSFIYWVVMLIGSLIVVFSIKSLPSTLTVVLKNRTLYVSTRLLGFVTQNEQIQFSEIEDVELK
ncbi:hypothetical protein [Leucothrix arctica]|uniref:Uncharacterized protein n=1 Tax=Leucothrix arctica TaxID=1481894 RepID=A0A317CBW2_9GAMM|nr:hypothetical protein [Leucothrix arctica]PWQ96036.1 hypothetical protein DKT75_10685 [Leucothrix arctica]